MENVIIIGSGPAGHTAAIYLARANLKPLMFEWFMAWGVAAGGQLTTTTKIENFPGRPEGIDGNELMARMRQQSLNAGTRIETKTVDKVDLSKRPPLKTGHAFKVYVGNEVLEANHSSYLPELLPNVCESPENLSSGRNESLLVLPVTVDCLCSETKSLWSSEVEIPLSKKQLIWLTLHPKWLSWSEEIHLEHQSRCKKEWNWILR